MANPAEDGSPGPWTQGRLTKWGRCGARMPEGSGWSARPCDCFVLLLTRDGSHGLDLSFVTHLFLINEVSDPAKRQQVVSRAHRMGATGPVIVETVLLWKD